VTAASLAAGPSFEMAASLEVAPWSGVGGLVVLMLQLADTSGAKAARTMQRWVLFISAPMG
jgi:hypothetical protein